VAHLAGIPKDVVRAARKHLGELEKQLRPGGAQPDLFAAPAAAEEPASHAALDALEDMRPDEMSPKEALEALYRLKDLSGR
jgi:DNA mismatch repair protein MutS